MRSLHVQSLWRRQLAVRVAAQAAAERRERVGAATLLQAAVRRWSARRAATSRLQNIVKVRIDLTYGTHKLFTITASCQSRNCQFCLYKQGSRANTR